jgi:hypothetical protein
LWAVLWWQCEICHDNIVLFQVRNSQKLQTFLTAADVLQPPCWSTG